MRKGPADRHAGCHSCRVARSALLPTADGFGVWRQQQQQQLCQQPKAAAIADGKTSTSQRSDAAKVVVAHPTATSQLPRAPYILGAQQVQQQQLCSCSAADVAAIDMHQTRKLAAQPHQRAAVAATRTEAVGSGMNAIDQAVRVSARGASGQAQQQQQ